MKTEYLLLFEDCRIVSGYNRILIYDLSRPGNSNVIPNELRNFVLKCQDASLHDVVASYSDKERIILKEYIEFLIEREFAFIGDEHMWNHMGLLDMTYEGPEIVQNAIVCLDMESDYINVFDQLDRMLCANIELRCRITCQERLTSILGSLSDTVLEAIVIRIDYSLFLTMSYLDGLIKENPRVKHIYVYSAPDYVEGAKFTFGKEGVDFIKDCGYINPNNFVTNQPFFLESQSCNTCLNKKVGIDFNGNIKNCPSMDVIRGNVASHLIMDVVKTEGFQQLWKINKDEIEVCKDCEYRHMCTDCRVFIDNDSNKYSRPSKCNYNPYISKWKGEEGYRTLAECGVKSDENGFEIDHERIKAINAELWEES